MLYIPSQVYEGKYSLLKIWHSVKDILKYVRISHSKSDDTKCGRNHCPD